MQWSGELYQLLPDFEPAILASGADLFRMFGIAHSAAIQLIQKG